MTGRTNASGGGGLTKSTLVVQTKTGSTVTATKGSETKTANEKYGLWSFSGLSAGEWTVKAVKDGISSTKTVTMDGTSSMTLILYFNTIPEFTYTGDFETVDDNNNPIFSTTGDWKIRLLTSGTLSFAALNGAEDGIDVFLVGGGAGGGNDNGGGGGAGYTKTVKNVPVSVGVSYAVTIGAGGSSKLPGNGTTFADLSVAGGKVSNKPDYDGGDGGSGGGGIDGGVGGIDGADGHGATRSENGKGQGTTTREFGESGGRLYSTGGNADRSGTPGTANTGDGGSGSSGYGGSGGSGIVIIRNHREGAA